MSTLVTVETAPPARWAPAPVGRTENTPAPRLFGHFLVAEGCIEPAALEEALALMAATNATVGELAVARGLMTSAEAEGVNRLQQFVDRRFGELAVANRVGAMTAQQLDALCWEQETSNIRLSDALVDLGYMSATEVDSWLVRFEASEAEQPDPLQTLPAALRDSASATLVLESLPRLAQRVLKMPARLGAARPWHGLHYQAHATAHVGGASPLAIGLSADAAACSAFTVMIECTDPHRRSGCPTAAIGRFVSLLGALVEHRVGETPELHGVGRTTAVLSELPRRGWAFDVVFGRGRAVLVLG